MWHHRSSRTLRAALAALAVTLSAAAAARATADSKAPEVQYGDDRLTVHMNAVPVAEGVKAIEAATGARVHGEIPPAGEISVDLDNVPLHEALGRLFGERNFAITYKGDGRPGAIELFGAPLPSAAPKPAVAAAAVPSPVPGSDGPGWPPDDQTRAAVLTLQAFLDRNPSIELDPALAAALGAPTITFHDLMKAAAQNDDRRLRARAWRRSVRAIREDTAAWDALVLVMSTAPEDSMRDFARHQLGPNAEELTRQLVRHAGPEVRRPAKAVLDQLAADPQRASGGAATP